MDEESEWKELLAEIGVWIEVQFVFNSRREKEIFQAIVLLAAHLEYLAAAVLWTYEGRPRPFTEYRRGHLTLGQSAREIEEKEIDLKPATVQILKDVATLRNGVAHRSGLFSGVPVRGDEGVGEYKGRHIFSDVTGLRQLVKDQTDATEDIASWYRRQPGQAG